METGHENEAESAREQEPEALRTERHGEIVPRPDEPIASPPTAVNGSGDAGGSTREIEVYTITPGEPVPSGGRPPGTVPVRRAHLAVVLLVLLIALAVIAVLLVSRPRHAAATVQATSSPTTASATPTPTQSTPGIASPSVSADATTSDTPSDQTSTTATPTDSLPAGSAPVAGSAFLGSPIDGGTSPNQDVQMSGTDYQNSTLFYCPQSQPDTSLNDWSSAGYSTFTAMVGIGDQEPNAEGSTALVTFFDQDKRQLGEVTVAVGHPQPVHLNIRGTTRLAVECLAKTRPGTDEFRVALGNGELNP